MILAQIVVATCPVWTPGDSLPVLLPPGCSAPIAGMWRTVEADAAIDDAVVALRQCADTNERLARELREVPEPVSRVTWALIGAGAAAAVFLVWTEAQ